MSHPLAGLLADQHAEANGIFVDWEYHSPGVLRIVLGIAMLVVTLAVAGRRILWLTKLIRSGKADKTRTREPRPRAENAGEEVLGQRKLLKWSGAGLAHFFTFWGFNILGITIVEAYGALVVSRDFAFPFFGHARWLGFLEDLFAAAVLVAIIWFSINRLRNGPERKKRSSRFYGSHNGPAWFVLFMIFLVVATLVLYRAAQYNTGHFPWGRSKAPFFSYAVAQLLPSGAINQGIETFFIVAQMAVVFAFLILVVHSKHLHIGTAPINVYFKRLPDGLGALPPVTDDDGKAIDFADVENLSEDTVFGKGKIEDFTWKGYLDFATCTECGRCQSQCPAWNTDKPLSPKLLIMDLRDHLFAKAPYIFGTQTVPDGATPNFNTPAAEGGDNGGPPGSGGVAAGRGHHVPEAGYPRIEGSTVEQALRPLVGDLAAGGVIDPDVLWSCTTCGACVEQCPVDIEHIDHIVDMRRYQVLIESAFPSEAGTMLRNIENKGNPWGMANSGRDEWMKELSFEVRRATPGTKLDADIDYLFWVGCAGALEDRSRKVTVAFAELLHVAGVEFAVLGQGESCTGDPARRLGNEFVYQMQGMQNVETLNSIERAGPLKIVATCPHCFNTIANEYPQLGGHYEVVHHTQLLGRLVEEGRLTPIEPVDKTVTYHDPCYLGRHNKVYTPPREVLAAIPSLTSQEMHRCKDRGFCCGAGGARFWMEEKIGKRINRERTDEAIGLDPDMIGTACPFCMVMLSDAVAEKKGDGSAKEHVEVLDVAQILRRSLGTPSTGDSQPEAASTS
ncbi:heterodisulfide reductase-related iron-sulfur binding cluster [Jatrophihabitans cynanchi]|uniref:Heterodisulfide reductase-related iron-sulfur binding cluster n=1 Tax=Jatrophihabitans cynanchi TaxID=2944128 RepID=A0ABY7JWD2_9ACTN|nr:(Fe-S)-binding protein [Jatrophihabitans sp. SB3-54]WAX55396.1 heterodisulfide reductase-related iron-sulfur binding cluster [Jatrophihabitans sp. SB3-54]